VYPPGALDELLPSADVVVNLLPHTPATDGLFDAGRFSLLRRGTLYVSAGRGETTSSDALLAALRDGRVGGAGLDVVDDEPVPPESPLWDAPRLLITPHVAWSGPDLGERRYGVVRENSRRFVQGEPLLAEIDKRDQY
jgi:phosphoglycerate dehydrogenase-like enzyme